MKLFSCSTQLSMKFQLLITTKMLANKEVSCLNSLRCCIYHAYKGALARYGKLTWESAHAWILKILSYLIVWGMTLIFMVRLSFYAIPLLIYDVMNDITIIL